MGLNSKLIVKYLSISIVTALSLCGIAFVILVVSSVTGGTGCRNKSIEARITLAKLDQSIQEFRLDLNAFPDQLSELHDSERKGWIGPYIKEKELKDPWGEFYHYRNYPERDVYQLFTLGSDKQIGGNDHFKDQISEGSFK